MSIIDELIRFDCGNWERLVDLDQSHGLELLQVHFLGALPFVLHLLEIRDVFGACTGAHIAELRFALE